MSVSAKRESLVAKTFGSGNELDTRWLGPVLNLKRLGNESYLVRKKPGSEITSHESLLKPYEKTEFPYTIIGEVK